jgi:hypothetical protein
MPATAMNHFVFVQFQIMLQHNTQPTSTGKPSMHTVSHGCVGLADQDRELAACTGGDELLASDGAVVNQGWDVNIIGDALARLVVSGETP